MNEIILHSKKELYLEKNKHFIQCFLDIKGGRSKYTAISYEKDIKDFFNKSDVTEITIENIREINIRKNIPEEDSLPECFLCKNNCQFFKLLRGKSC